MTTTRTADVWRNNDHFQPDSSLDPKAQRRLRGQLDKIDYTAYASNCEVIGHVLGATDVHKFQRMAVAAAQARAGWIKAALEASESAHLPSPQQVEKLAQWRTTYQELAEAYDAMRRLVERGYLTCAS